MPGNVATASPSAVFPHLRCARFTEVRTYTRTMNDFADGSNIRRVQEQVTSRKAWQMVGRLGPNEWATLRAFLASQNGAPFYFYVLHESNWNVDPTGANSLGRYTVRFEGTLDQISRLGSQWEAQVQLVEVA